MPPIEIYWPKHRIYNPHTGLFETAPEFLVYTKIYWPNHRIYNPQTGLLETAPEFWVYHLHSLVCILFTVDPHGF